MRIHVTADDIKNGVRRTCTLCPVALALRRATGQNAVVVVKELYPTGIGRVCIASPAQVQWFIRDFDGGLPVKPFYFTIPDAFRVNKEAR